MVPHKPSGQIHLQTVEERKEYLNRLITHQGVRLPGHPLVAVEIDTGHHQSSTMTRSEVLSSEVMWCRILDTPTFVEFVVRRDDLIKQVAPRQTS